MVREVGGVVLGWSCFGASDHGPVSFRRVGQVVDLPGEARRGAMICEARAKVAA